MKNGTTTINIKPEQVENLNKKGIYGIFNLKNRKYYIGSTSLSFLRRFHEHISRLNNNKHKNEHLQRAWNKYGKENFEFRILETCEEKFYEIEQRYIDELGYYNINKAATGSHGMSKVVIQKRTKSFTETVRVAMEYLKKVKNNKITLKDVPEKYAALVKDRFERSAWNKGLDSSIIDYSYLKGVKKTKTKKLEESRKRISNNLRMNKLPSILVFNMNDEFLGEWRSSKDLEEDSIKNNFILSDHMILRNKEGRNGFSPYILQSCNINKCASGLKDNYKGLKFKYKNTE